MATVASRSVASETLIESRPMDPSEQYPVTLTFVFHAGKAETQTQKVCLPMDFKGKHLVTSVREPNLFFMTRMDVGHCQCLIGDSLDLVAADDDRPDPVLGCPISLPWLNPGVYFEASVRYTGRVPVGHVAGHPLLVTVTIVGESRRPVS